MVGGDHVKPKINKLEAMKSFPVPKTKKEVQSFLGLMGYYRNFIKDYMAITVLLTNLIRRKCREAVVWKEECVKAFNALKNMLTSTPFLNNQDFEIFFKQNYGVGAVMSQTDAEALEHP